MIIKAYLKGYKHPPSAMRQPYGKGYIIWLYGGWSAFRLRIGLDLDRPRNCENVRPKRRNTPTRPRALTLSVFLSARQHAEAGAHTTRTHKNSHADTLKRLRGTLAERMPVTSRHAAGHSDQQAARLRDTQLDPA
eukprot:5516416-Prymnesium_polylepis.1